MEVVEFKLCEPDVRAVKRLSPSVETGSQCFDVECTATQVALAKASFGISRWRLSRRYAGLLPPKTDV